MFEALSNDKATRVETEYRTVNPSLNIHILKTFMRISVKIEERIVFPGGASAP